ncbi:MAG: tetratricopeptide repeat protein [Limisphaerales bacterium]|nr:MAG: tetratricopeptide repeat protein [Limisphaerales bacterium]
MNLFRNTFLLSQLLWVVILVSAENKQDDQQTFVVEKEFRSVLLLDDKIHSEVDQWIRDNAKLTEKKSGIPVESLGEQIRIRLSKVEEAYVSFLAKYPKHVEARLAFGSFYSGLGKHDAAMGQWTEARDLEKQNPVPWNNMGKAYGQKGKISEAIRHFSKASELAPKQPLYYRNLAAMLFAYPDQAARYYLIDRSQVVPKVLLLFEKALILDPKNFTLATDTAMIYLATSPFKAKEAINAWNKALSLAPDIRSKEGVRIHLARIHARIGEPKVAQKLLLDVRDPNFNQLKEEILKKIDSLPSTNSTSQ